MAEETGAPQATDPDSPWSAQVLRRTDFHAAIRRNERHTFWLCVLMVAIGGGLGFVVGWAIEVYYRSNFEAGALHTPESAIDALTFFSPWGVYGAAAMVLAGAFWIFVALTVGDRILLAVAGAREVTVDEEPVLHNVVEEMAIASGLPKPRVAVMETPALNAFATGLKPERAAVAVTRGLIDQLERDELQGVVGHEMGHIANNDILYATAVGVIVGLIALVADGALRSLRHGAFHGGRRRGGGKGGGGAALVAIIVLVVVFIVAPLAARLVQMAISREREYLADATAVKFTRNPHGLIGALEKIDRWNAPFPGANRATQHLFIANPFKNFGDRSGALLSTHPPINRRIERLRDLA